MGHQHSNDHPSSTNGHRASTNGHAATAPRPTHPRIGVPELAGVCTYREAARGGLGVEENVGRLKRYNWVETRLSDLVMAHLTGTPEWEVKDGLALHNWLDTEHARWLQERVAELRHPPHNFHKAPDEALDAWLQEAFWSQGAVELLTALYRCIHPALLAAYREHMEATHPLVDFPTRRFMRFSIQEEEEMIAWGEAALEALLVDDRARARSAAWQAHLDAYLAAAGGILGKAEKPSAALPPARAHGTYQPDFTPRRDDRFESHNYHFPPHWIYSQVERPADERMLALVCKRLLEMDVPEMMTSIVWRAKQEARQEGKSKPWAYTNEMSRQLWDEARHSMMGEAWLVAHGIDFTRVPLNIGFSALLNEAASALEAHATLYWIEQGLMPQNTGKAYEWRTASESGDELATLFMDYDWADEVLHVHIGRWLIDQVGSRKEAERLGAEAFSRVMGLRKDKTVVDAKQHEWWPDFCEDVLGFRPLPLAEDYFKTDAKDAPWLKNG